MRYRRFTFRPEGTISTSDADEPLPKTERHTLMVGGHPMTILTDPRIPDDLIGITNGREVAWLKVAPPTLDRHKG